MSKIVVAALYKFSRLEDFQSLREPLLDVCIAADVKGTILLAREGVNGTIAGPREGIDRVLSYLRRDPRLADLEHKESFDERMPFHRMKVKLKREIVTMGVEGIDPNEQVGTYVPPAQWNELVNDPDVLLLDTRNDYEYGIGTFQGALDSVTIAEAERLRAAVRAGAPGVPLSEVLTLEQTMFRERWVSSFFSRLLGLYAVAATLIAALGLYGLTAETTSRRTRELAVRMALGARGADVRRMVLWEAITVAIIGAGMSGILAAYRFKQAGIDAAYVLYEEAGVGFADHVCKDMDHRHLQETGLTS